jgi:hypothetical protein
MTALNPEAKTPEAQAQTPPDTAIPPASDTKLSQNKPETPPSNSEQSKEPETAEDPNWKAFREARKKDRIDREAAERRASEKEEEVAALKAAMEAAFSKSAPSPQAYQQYYGMNQPTDQPEETEEQRIERKVNQLLAKKEEQYKREQSEHEQREYPNRLKREMPDFSAVCSQENLDYLDFHFPELSRPLQRLPDGYDKWSDIYHAVKKFIPNHSTAKKEIARAEINANKPRSMSSTGPSPTGDAPKPSWQESEQRRAENWARMQRIIKSTG